MANKDFPSGLIPFGKDPQIEYMEASVTTAIFKGDVVARKAAGRIHAVVTTTGSVNIIGVAAEYSKAANTPAVKIAVYSDPQQKFIVQDDGAGATTTNFNKSLAGKCAPLIVTTGNTSTGISKQELDISSAAAGATTDPLKIINVADYLDNESGVSHMKWVVMLNRHIKTAFRVGI